MSEQQPIATRPYTTLAEAIAKEQFEFGFGIPHAGERCCTVFDTVGGSKLVDVQALPGDDLGPEWFAIERQGVNYWHREYTLLDRLGFTLPDLVALNQTPPEPIIEGIANRGEWLMIASQIGVGKSWFLEQLLIQAAAGGSLLGHRIPKPCKGLLIEPELSGFRIADRLKRIADAYGIDIASLSNLTIWPVRRTGVNLDQIAEAVRHEHFDIIGCDSTFMVTPSNGDENSNAHQTQIAKQFIQLAETTNALLVTVTHTRKGDISEVSAVDLAIGGNAQSRAADRIFALYPHAMGKNYLTVQQKVRHFEHVEPFVIEFDFPIFKLCNDPNIDPADIKKTGTKNKVSAEQMESCLPEQPVAKLEFIAAMCDRFQSAIKPTTSIVQQLIDSGKARVVSVKGDKRHHIARATPCN